MPIFILFVGILLVVVGINNKIPELVSLVKEDFRPTENVSGFHMWVLAIFVAGALGYVKSFRPVANALLALIIIVMLLSNKGFFAGFKNAIEGKA
jgi:uncharacterized membrane protein HdeD (DUF308 family)